MCQTERNVVNFRLNIMVISSAYVRRLECQPDWYDNESSLNLPLNQILMYKD
jgi:hypothetical protein